MKNEYDVIVVGGGPTGSTAAYHAGLNGLSVLLLEKDREFGTPVRCAEGVSEKGLKQFVDIDPRWVSTKITKISMTAPNRKTIEVNSENEVGLVLERKIFDYDLARLAVSAGAEAHTRSNVYDLILGDDKHVRGVKLKTPGGSKEIKSKIVIGADGVESRIGRKAGIVTVTKMKDMESGIQATVSGIDIDPEKIQFFLSSFWAPGGYLWIFPKGKNLANIGLGVIGNYKGDKKALDFLNEFLAEFFPDASIMTLIAGGIPVAKTLKRICAGGIMLAGDAARMVNPITGGGIVAGMQAGRLAAIRATEAIKANDFSETFLTEYANRWHKISGKKHEMEYRIKDIIYSFNDEDLNHIADKVSALPEKKRTLMKIFSYAVWKKPSLLIDVAKVFARY